MTGTTDDPTRTGGRARLLRPLYLPLYRLANSPRRLVVAILGIWVGLSMVYALLEGKGPVESLWWGIVTGSTVGYGDFYPESTAGRGVASLLIVTMLILVPIAIGHFIAFLVADRNEFSHEEQVALARSVAESHEKAALALHLVREDLRARHGDAWLATHEQGWAAAEDARRDACEDAVELFSRSPVDPGAPGPS